jgi:hypothetical protein
MSAIAKRKDNASTGIRFTRVIVLIMLIMSNLQPKPVLSPRVANLLCASLGPKLTENQICTSG